MLFLLRCMLCLSIVYASILGFTAARTSARPEVSRAVALGARAGDAVAGSARSFWSEHPVERLAALVALGRFGVPPRPDPSAVAGSARSRDATDAALPRHRREAFRLTRTP